MLAKIVWQTKSPVVSECFNKKSITSIIKGGNSYNFYALTALAQKFDVSIDKNAIKNNDQSMVNYIYRNYNRYPKADVTIKENYPLVACAISKNSKNIAIIHHVDEIHSGGTFGHKLFFKMLLNRLPKMDLVITVSEYWKNYLLEKGCKNVKVIYNSFNVEDYNITGDAKIAFRKKYNLSDRPVIYIGNAHRQKGVYEAYDALKEIDAEFIMTGAKNIRPDIPAKFLSLDKHDFISLLHTSELVVLMSKLNEGWNRVAHEALLCKTPVIGSGSGGMHELLTKSNQVISDVKNLKENVIQVLKNRDRYIESGYKFAIQYDMNYFNTAWQTAVKNIIM